MRVFWGGWMWYDFVPLKLVKNFTLRDRTINATHVLEWLAQIQPIFLVKTSEYILTKCKNGTHQPVKNSFIMHYSRSIKRLCIWGATVHVIYLIRGQNTLHPSTGRSDSHDYTRCLHSSEYLWQSCTWKYNQSIKFFFEKKMCCVFAMLSSQATHKSRKHLMVKRQFTQN